MKSCWRVPAGPWGRWLIGFFAVFGSVGVWRASAQAPPPVQGTIALEGTMKTFYRAANTIIVTTIDGVEHVYHFAKDLVVHGGKGAGVEALEQWREGSTVAVHYRVSGGDESASEIDRVGGDGLQITEGVVVHIDRGRREVTVRFEAGRTEKFRLTERAALEGGGEGVGTPGEKVVIYYTDDAGHKVAHYFRKAL